ncbi:MAG TPA: DUF6290 family protein, partial [bacterium]|nr:DUF6290 family protein [bacterium]
PYISNGSGLCRKPRLSASSHTSAPYYNGSELTPRTVVLRCNTEEVAIMATLEKTLTVRLTPEERMAVEEYAKENNMTIAQLARASLLEKIEDAYDLEVYTAWLKSKRETVSFEDLMKECGFSEDDL